VNDAGMTPTIGYPLPPKMSTRPIAEGLRLKRLVQNRSLMTTAFAPVSRSSSSVNHRPAAGRCP